MPQYIIYCRKSSESEERQILSIESQLKELDELTKRLNLPVLEVLTESQSAKSPGRPIFNDMMKKIYRSQAKGIICWKLDRLARNPVDGSSLVWALDQGKVAEIVTPHGKFVNNSNDKFLMQIEFGMAKKYVDDLSDNVKRGNRAKLEKGWLPNLPPLGYLNEPKERTIIKDLERFPLIRKMWELLLQGILPSQILRIANEQWGFRTRTHKKIGGKPLSSSGLYKIFGNSFYYGLIERKDGVYQGKHTPIITESEFWKGQELLGRRGQQRSKTHDFAFTGLIRCGECGSMITAEEKDKGGHHYIYYRCSKKRKNTPCSQRYISLPALEDEVTSYLNQIHIPDEFVRLAFDFVRSEDKREKIAQADIQKSLENAQHDCQKRLNNLNQMRLRELINDDEYIMEKRRIIDERIRLNENSKNVTGKMKAIELTEKLIIFANFAMRIFQKGTLKEKREILQGIGSNFLLKDKKLSIQVEKPFLILQNGLEAGRKEIDPLETQNNAMDTGENRLFVATILQWCTSVEDVRTFFENNPDFSKISMLEDIKLAHQKSDNSYGQEYELDF